MKKIIGIILAVILVFGGMSAFAETVNDNESEFERVLLKKGSLIIKEFIDYGTVEGMDFQSACIIDVETGEKLYALRIEASYWNSKYDYGTTVGVLDADEIDGAIATLEYVKNHIHELKDYSEVIYTAASGMQVGAYRSDEGNKVFIKISSDSTKFYNVNVINNLIKAFKGVQATFVNG